MISVYHKMTPKTQTLDFTAGYLYPKALEGVPTHLSQWSLPKTQAFRVDHIGDYGHLGNAWSAANQHVRYKKMKQSKVGTFELYKNSPDDTPPEYLLTEVYLPLK
jgi:effector-binding domain-containing protein